MAYTTREFNSGLSRLSGKLTFDIFYGTICILFIISLCKVSGFRVF